MERPAVPHYIESWEGHKSKIREKYPLMIISPHPRFTFHTQYDKHTDWINEIPTHRIVKDGYAWWPVRINPVDAAKRGINNNDVVKLYNDRGTVLCIAVISERVPPGVVHSYGSAANYDPIEPGKAGSVDRGGCVNILTSSTMMSKNAPGMTPNSCLIEIGKWEG
jgi:trimethylamine-N-oxide reductase (cytochrome c)